jgi:hypothetical protein
LASPQSSLVGEPRLLAFEIAVEFTLSGGTLRLKPAIHR